METSNIVRSVPPNHVGGKEEIVNTCLNCKWEPEWSAWKDAGYKRCYGKCRYPVELPRLPQVYVLTVKGITRYGDDSGVCRNCAVWTPKEEG